jgi:hypothetical protein
MRTAAPRLLTLLLIIAAGAYWASVPRAEEEKGDKPAAETGPSFGEPPGAKRLDPKVPVWIDVEKKLVIVDGAVCLREGQLEMFACLKGTKEHESVVSVGGKAYFVHAGLLAVGAKVGGPVQFDPKYVPASGTEVEVTVLWIDKDGKKHQVRAQEWIRNSETKKPMTFPWVFAGSGFWTDETEGRQYYLGESGDFICVSNFPSATLDLPIESSAANSALLFEAFTENIPAFETPVQVILTPRLAAPAAP